MLILSFFLALSMLVFVLVAREPLSKEESLRSMGQLGRALLSTEPLPSRVQMLKMNITGRSFDLESVIYEPHLVPANAPGNTVIAYLPLRNFRFIPSGHPVLCRNGYTEWLTPKELDSRLQQRARLGQDTFPTHSPAVQNFYLPKP